jgi:hypothetical protein
VTHSSRPVIEAVLTNTNTSLLAELAVRSLYATLPGPERRWRMQLTVLDNHSDDAGLPDLKAAAAELGVRFELSRFPYAASDVSSHGDCLRDFVLSRPDCDYYLFLHSDIEFHEPGVVDTMLSDLEAAPDAWASQARFPYLEETKGPGASLDISLGRTQELEVVKIDEAGRHPRRFSGNSRGAVNTACCLVVNSELFRNVVDRLGLGPGVVVSLDPHVAAYHGCAGLVSEVMAATGRRYLLSAAAILHLFGGSYDPDHVRRWEGHTRQRVERLRGASPVG